MKIRFCILLFLVYTCIFCISGNSYGESVATPNRVVKAGIFPFEGYHMRDDEDTLSGYGIDLLNLISKYSHLNFEYAGLDQPWGQMTKMLENGEIDVVTSARRTPERQDKFLFSRPIGRSRTILSISLDNSIQKPGQYQTYNDMLIGLLAGSSQNEKLAKFAENRGFTYRTKEFDNADDMVKALHNGDIDAIMTSNLRKSEDEQILDIVDSNNFYAITRKEDKELMDEINYAIEQLDQNEGDWKNNLFYKYYGPKYSSYLTFTDRENNYITDVNSGKKNITVTSSIDLAPYSYVENGELKGILPEYFASLMKSVGLPYTTVVPKDRADYENLAHNGVDIVIDRIMEEVPKANTKFRGFNSVPYLATTMARVTRHDFNGDIRTAAVHDANSKLPLENIIDSTTEVIHFSTPEAAIEAVRDGKADAAYVYAYSAQQFVNHDPASELYYTMLNDKNTAFHIYLRDTSDHELLTIINKVLKHMPEGLENHLISKYTSFTINDMNISQYLRAHPATIIILALLLGCIACIIILMYFRIKWNRELLRATAKSNRKLESQLAIVDALSRDYTNVYAINDRKDSFNIIKFEGYQIGGITPDKSKEQPYTLLVRTYINDRVHPEDRDYMVKAMNLDTVKRKLAESGEYTGSFKIIEDGQTHHCQFTFVKVNTGNTDGETFTLLGFRNIDEMIRHEQEQKDALAEALARARYANTAKTTFLNNMSHDIRTPMNAIIGFTSLAVSNLDNPQQVRNYLGKILTSGNHLLSLINDVLDMSRIESGKVKIDEKEANLPDILHDLQVIVQADITSKKLDFRIEAPEVTDEKIITDKLRLNQVLLNILSNAIKYTKRQGKVTITVSESPTEDPLIHNFVFKISDTGIGMSPEFLKHVFEPFEREHTATVSGIQGTGLGLAITKNIVDMMRGQIAVESRAGEGSTFTVSFPFRIVANEQQPDNLSSLVGTRALVVSKDSRTFPAIAPLLARMGISAGEATSKDDAVQKMRDAQEMGEPVSLVFISSTFGRPDNMELARGIRELGGAEPTIIQFAAPDSAVREHELFEAGINIISPRPIFISELRKLLGKSPANDKGASPDKDFTDYFKGKKVLLVDDNEMNQEIGQMILEEAGFEVDIADDGTTALKLIQNQDPGTYDIILMDVQMPMMNGYDATRAIRDLHDPLKAGIPIIAMTANAFEEDRTEAMEAGMNGYVPKPIDIQILLQTLQEMLVQA